MVDWAKDRVRWNKSLTKVIDFCADGWLNEIAASDIAQFQIVIYFQTFSIIADQYLGSYTSTFFIQSIRFCWLHFFSVRNYYCQYVFQGKNQNVVFRNHTFVVLSGAKTKIKENIAKIAKKIYKNYVKIVEILKFCGNGKFFKNSIFSHPKR